MSAAIARQPEAADPAPTAAVPSGPPWTLQCQPPQPRRPPPPGRCGAAAPRSPPRRPPRRGWSGGPEGRRVGRRHQGRRCANRRLPETQAGGAAACIACTLTPAVSCRGCTLPPPLVSAPPPHPHTCAGLALLLAAASRLAAYISQAMGSSETATMPSTTRLKFSCTAGTLPKAKPAPGRDGGGGGGGGQGEWDAKGRRRESCRQGLRGAPGGHAHATTAQPQRSCHAAMRRPRLPRPLTHADRGPQHRARHVVQAELGVGHGSNASHKGSKRAHNGHKPRQHDCRGCGEGGCTGAGRAGLGRQGARVHARGCGGCGTLAGRSRCVRARAMPPCGGLESAAPSNHPRGFHYLRTRLSAILGIKLLRLCNVLPLEQPGAEGRGAQRVADCRGKGKAEHASLQVVPQRWHRAAAADRLALPAAPRGAAARRRPQQKAHPASKGRQTSKPVQSSHALA